MTKNVGIPDKSSRALTKSGIRIVYYMTSGEIFGIPRKCFKERKIAVVIFPRFETSSTALIGSDRE